MRKAISYLFVMALGGYLTGNLTGSLAFGNTGSWVEKTIIRLVEKYYELDGRVKVLEQRLYEMEKKTQSREREEKEKYGVKPKVVAQKNLNLRTCPSVRCKTVGPVKQGEVLEVLGVEKEWFRVKNSYGVAGWINSKFVVEYSY